MGAALSQDEWHDPIDPKVIKAFTNPDRFSHKESSSRDCREIRNVTYGVVNAGRAKLNQISRRDDCVCDSIVVEPSGKLWQCGCRKRSFGTVFNPQIPEEYTDYDNACSRRAA